MQPVCAESAVKLQSTKPNLNMLCKLMHCVTLHYFDCLLSMVEVRHLLHKGSQHSAGGQYFPGKQLTLVVMVTGSQHLAKDQ